MAKKVRPTKVSPKTRGFRVITPIVEQAIEYIEDHAHMPDERLSRMIFAEFPMLFDTVGQARNKVHFYRGTEIIGHSREKRQERKTRIAEAGRYRANREIYERLPKPMEKLSDWEPFPLDGECMLILSDIHIPFHDEDALRIALEYAEDECIDSILLNGDIIDFYAISVWEKNEKYRNLANEIDATKQFLTVLRDIWPDIPIYYKPGNHENRWMKYLRKTAPDLEDIEAFRFSSVMGLDELDIELLPEGCYATFGKLPIIHGHELGKSGSRGNSVSAARTFWLQARESMLGGHYHSTSSNSERLLRGRNETTFSVGCLCDLNPDYLPVNDWNHGFAIVELEDDDGRYQVYNKKIIRGRVFEA